jgi:hypothetical protein
MSIDWTETDPADMPAGTIVQVDDDTTAVCAPLEGSLRAMMEEYASTYGFNSPGDVECIARVYGKERGDESDAIETMYFTVRSDDGHRGYLAA